MFVPGRVSEALEMQRDVFLRAAEEAARLEGRFRVALDALSGLPPSDLAERLRAHEWPGAMPTSELSERGLIIPFEPRWATARDAREWALERLRGIPTVAIDGSQIAASKEFGVPISLAQVAWFENRHDPDLPYVKEVVNEIVTPGTSVDDVEEYAYAESKLNGRRFSLEMRVAVDRIYDLSREPVPVVLVDGSFVLSFIGRMAPQSRPVYLQALFSLLEASREKHIPTVGYVDLSYASDIVTMLRTLFDLPPSPLFDARVLTGRMKPFDRTAAFECARGDVLPHYHFAERDYSHDLCFVYLKVGADLLPARIDFPRWILEANLLDYVIDIIRAEIVVGTGYPYALETADAVAVLTTEDRLAFYRLFHDFARNSGLTVSMPGKSVSKFHRR